MEIILKADELLNKLNALEGNFNYESRKLQIIELRKQLACIASKKLIERPFFILEYSHKLLNLLPKKTHNELEWHIRQLIKECRTLIQTRALLKTT